MTHSTDTPVYKFVHYYYYYGKVHLAVNQMRVFILGTHGIVSHIYYHCDGALLASVIIL